MKIGGKLVSGPKRDFIIFDRTDENGEPYYIQFKAEAVLNYDEFDKLCPEPAPPSKMIRGGEIVQNIEDSSYKESIRQRGEQWWSWLVIKSLSPSNIEWDTVEYANSATWQNYKSDLSKAGFSRIEINRIENLVLEINSIDEKKLHEARERFLRSREAGVQMLSSSQTEERSSMPSIVPVNGSV